MMKKALVVVAISILGVLVLLSFVRRYHIRQYLEHSQVLWHENECFIALSVETNGWQGSILEESLWYIKTVLGFSNVPEGKSRKDLIIYSVRAGTLTKHYLKGFKAGGSLFPSNGAIYYSVGVENPPIPVWQWNESGLQKLNDSDAEHILSSYRNHKETVAREGWSEYENILALFNPHNVLPINLTTGSLVITLTENDQHHKTLSLTGQNLQKPEEVLWAQDGDWKQVSKDEYLKATEP